jgi:hypothetical protein
MDAKLTRNTGSEGPSHDPYSYTEQTVEKDGKTVTLHLGLAEWLKVDGKRTEGDAGPLAAEFEKLTGFNPETFDVAYDAIHDPEHCPKCQSTERKTESGMPGEKFLVCGSCGEIIDTRFNRREIE